MPAIGLNLIRLASLAAQFSARLIAVILPRFPPPADDHSSICCGISWFGSFRRHQ